MSEKATIPTAEQCAIFISPARRDGGSPASVDGHFSLSAHHELPARASSTVVRDSLLVTDELRLQNRISVALERANCALVYMVSRMSARRARTRRSQYGEQLFQVRGLLHLCHSAYRQIIQTTALKVIYLSGYTRDSLLSQETFEEGTEFIEKPFTRDAIPDRISRVLRT